MCSGRLALSRAKFRHFRFSFFPVSANLYPISLVCQEIHRPPKNKRLCPATFFHTNKFSTQPTY